ncbi:chemotaxis response regulator protein-glutamate methylesterase [Desulfitobacterium sp.]|uniref:protein-glutamate methylesterase/protein-glutamine glutaminase n=1 Tax=Desulfitobacterium sp. TaxID=49981 RepID=UPI002C3928C2|nr:chemotaxis response regulator protein-glutamate methylesterase [Desulfitobacterium sp.]HVJ49538.1 chemotaxis response regulator protein-glutamate methylesterase [Desulfitobacterium sp.]
MNPATKELITVLIVDDSPFMRITLQKILNQDPEIKVLDTARDGREGIEKLQTLHPQVITMDVEMPVMNGLQALDEIMRWQPTPVIILSSVTTEGTQATIKALEYGAFDIVAKPSGKPGDDLQVLAQDLIEKVKGAAHVDPTRLGKKRTPVRTTLKNSPPTFAQSSAVNNLNRTQSQPSRAGASNRSLSYPKHPVEIVAIGTSTGGPSALQTVLPQLPANFPVPVIVAQHMPPGFTGPLAQRLNGLCALNVREGINGEPLKAGTVYVAPAGKQIQVVRRTGQLLLQIGDESPISTLYHPSVDVMFLSLAKEVGKRALGVVMTGMGNDGLKGMREIKALEGFAIAEAEETCVVYGMPRSIVDAGLADRVVPLGEIGHVIVECVQRKE